MKKLLSFLFLGLAALCASAADGWLNLDGKHLLSGKALSETDVEFRPVLVLRVRDWCLPSAKAIQCVKELRERQKSTPLAIVVTEATGQSPTRKLRQFLDARLPYYGRVDVQFSPDIHTNDMFGVTNSDPERLTGCSKHRGFPDPYIVGPAGLVVWKGLGGYTPSVVDAEVKKALELTTDEGMERDFRRGAVEYPGFILHKLIRLAKQRRNKLPPGLSKLREELQQDSACVRLSKFYDYLLKLPLKDRSMPAHRKRISQELESIKDNCSSPAVHGEIHVLEVQIFGVEL